MRNLAFIPTDSSNSFLVRDCEVATYLLPYFLERHPDTSTDRILTAMQQQLAAICVFQWNEMQIVDCSEESIEV